MPPEDDVTRKLRAILSADVKGYSLLMANDEAFTVKTLKSYRKVMSAQIVRHKGRVVDTPGDNLLSEFASVVDAVQCAVEIQKILKEKNKDLPPDKRLEFRIGVNIGDVIQDGDNIYGAGVNVAARIEGLADAGGICISRNAFNHVKDKLNYGYEYLGEHVVKNIKDPIRVYKVLMSPKDVGKLVGERKKSSMVKLGFLIIVGLFLISTGVLGGLYWKYLYLPAPPDVDFKTIPTTELMRGHAIAVLPFVNMTGDPDEDGFCDGFTEMLISTLSYSPDLLVIARNSSFAYKGKQKNIQEIGKELNAEYIIEGSVQKSKKRIRIIVQLINAVSGHHEWSKAYDKEFKDIFQLQDEIVQEIFKAIGEELVWGGTIKNVFQGVKSNEELKMLNEAVTFWEMESPESSHRAQEISLELIEMNSTIPMAYTVLSSTYLQSIFYDKCASATICGAKAMAALKKALSLNEDFDWAHIVSGQFYLGIGEHDKAVNYYKTAISLNPNNAYAYNHLGNALIFFGHPDKAIVHINKAISLNPKQSYTLFFALGFAHQDMRDFKNAIVFYNKSLSLNPDYWSSYIGLVIVHGHMGNSEKAKYAIDNLFRIRPDFSVSNFLKGMPYKYETSRDFLREGIQKAGLKIEE